MTSVVMNGVRYEVAALPEHDQILDFLRKFYYSEEPITIGHPQKKSTPDDEKFTMSHLGEGTIFKASDVATGQLVGILVSGPIRPGDVEAMHEEAKETESKKWGDIIYLLAHMQAKANVCERFKVEKSLNVHVLGVDGAHRGKSIGANLVKFCMENAKRLGYKMLSMDCTSVYSIALAERLDMECVAEQAFADYRNPEGVVLFKPPSPHTHIKTFIQRL